MRIHWCQLGCNNRRCGCDERGNWAWYGPECGRRSTGRKDQREKSARVQSDVSALAQCGYIGRAPRPSSAAVKARVEAGMILNSSKVRYRHASAASLSLLL